MVWRAWMIVGLAGCGLGPITPTDTDTDLGTADSGPDVGDSGATGDSGADTTDTTDTGDTSGDSGSWTDTDTDVGDSGAPPPIAWRDDLFTPDWSDFVDCSGASTIRFDIAASDEGLAAMWVVETRSASDLWSEFHTLDETAVSGGVARFSRTLTTGASVAQQTTDASTLYICGSGAASLQPSSNDFRSAFAVAIWPVSAAAVLGDGDASNDPAPDDCVAFGKDAASMFGRTPVAAAAPRPRWVTQAGGRVLAP